MKYALETEDTTKNRPLFEQELESRSISNFIAKIELAASN